MSRGYAHPVATRRPVSKPRRGRALLLLAAALAVAGGVLWFTSRTELATRPVGPGSIATFESGFRPFSQLNRLHGTLRITRARAASGRRSAEATYDGSGINGYARAIYNVNWRPGAFVSYGASFFIPASTIDSLHGELAIMRWDDYSLHPDDPNYGGLVVFGSGPDHRARLIQNELGPNPSMREVSTPFALPTDRWFRVEVHQRLAPDGDALNQVLIDGRTVTRTRSANIPAGRSVSRLRFGVVAIASGAQKSPLELWFDDARATPGAVAGER
jgi:hypothetical protein